MASDENFSIEWNNLSYSVSERHLTYETPFKIKMRKDQKMILQTQSGRLSSGTLTALMGPSGAGKTTLLNCLSGKIKNGWDGDVIFKSYRDANQNNPDLKMAFVPQKDHLFNSLTVRETLSFAIRFKNVTLNLSADDRDKKVDKTASDLNLTSCLDVKVSNLSGGQMKRLSVGVEIVSTPNVLILDEPTSGLDATNALIIMKVIRRLLDTGHEDANAIKPAIICSIHQPSFDCLKLFDKIYLLSENGSKIFFDSPLEVPSHLKLRKMALPDHYNPADYLLDLCYQDGHELNQTPAGITVETPSRRQSAENIAFGGQINPAFADNADAKFNQRPFDLDPSTFEVISIDNQDNQDQDKELIIKNVIDAAEETRKNLKSNNYFTFFNLLMIRNWRVLMSSPTPLLIRIIFCFTNIFIPFLFNHKLGSHDGCWNTILGTDADTDATHGRNKSLLDLISLSPDANDGGNYVRRMELVNDNLTFILILTNFSIYFHSLITVSTVPTEVEIIRKEVSNNWYTINAFIASRIIFFLPIMAIQCIVFVGVGFIASSQLMDAERLLIAISTLILLAFTAEMVGIIVGSLLPGNVIASTIFTILYTMPVIIFGGYFVRVKSASPFVSLFMWASQLRHAFEALIVSIYGLNRCSACDGTAVKSEDFLNPNKMMERFFIDYDINHRDADIIAPVLGVPHEYCVAEIINGTRDYLGVRYDDDSYQDFVEDNEDAACYSYPLTSFGLTDNDLYRCFYCLLIIAICYVIVAIICVRKAIKN